MDSNEKKPQLARAPKSVLARQMIVSGIALGIMGLGAWSLLGRNAPYHPEIYTDEVTRSGTAGLISTSADN